MGIEKISSAQYRAAQIMTRYGMTKEDMMELMQIAVDAGIEICLQEQENIRTRSDAAVSKAFGGLVH